MPPLRQLVLIRHTKSSWADFSLPDFDRPIKKDRVDDAKNMAAKLKALKLEPDLIICSPAKRTRQTVTYFCDKLKYEEEKIQFEKRIYESSAEEILQVVRETGAGVKTLVIVGHNPSITHFANLFIAGKIDEVPTTGVVWLEFENDDWEIYRQTPCRLKWFLTPKTI
jgi:phosphohistidine phosphatase